jgi:hypothetical protein
MINTKCGECMFASSNHNNETSACSRNIIEQIKNIKNITQDGDGFNVIENYACRYGFSKQVYEQNKELLSDGFEARLTENSKIRYYLLLDCCDSTIDFDAVLDTIKSLDIPPKAISFMFRDLDYRPFGNNHQDFLLSNYKDTHWKVHNFVENIELEKGIDHILSTNAKNNNTSIFLVYNAKDLGSLSIDITAINNHIVLYQSPMIAMIDKNNSLYRLAMSFENYKVAKSLSDQLIKVLCQETNIIHY